LFLHVQIRIEELLCGLSDVLMQLGSIHARRIDIAVGIIVSSHLIALIVEDLVTNLTGQHVELGMRDIFAANSAFSLGGVAVSPAPSRPKAVRAVELALASTNSMLVTQAGRRMFSAYRSGHLFGRMRSAEHGDL
jgi:hypothetical protein